MSAKQWITITAVSVLTISAIAGVAVSTQSAATVASNTTPQVAATIPSTISAEPLASVAKLSPNVTKRSGIVQFAVSIPADVKPQRVEFYIESKLIAAVYSAPYTASVSENSLAAGNHQVTAKVYTTDSNVQTQAMSFQSSVTTNAIATNDTAATDQLSSTAPTPSPSIPQAPAQSIGAPGEVTASVNIDGSVSVQWSQVANAASYQIWRDGALLQTVATTTYADTAVSPGLTYDYTIVSVDAAGAVSEQSAVAAVTVPQNTTVAPKSNRDCAVIYKCQPRPIERIKG